MHRGLPIDFRYEDRGHATTTVFFHAALGPKITRLPVFLGKSFSQDVAVNRLFVADPTLHIDDKLRLAWYAGSSRQPDLQEVLAQVFAKISGSNRTIYFGASGGGYAALYYSAQHPSSLAIPLNPQTNIARYVPAFVERWASMAWQLEKSESGHLEMPDTVTNLVEVYEQPRGNHVLYVQNTGDALHMEAHWSPFIEKVNPSNDIVPFLQFVGEGHVPPPVEQLKELLKLAAASQDWSTLDVLPQTLAIGMEVR